MHPDRMWHYVEGIRNWDPIWSRHGIRILPGPSSLWLDAVGRRLPVPLFPGLRHAGHARAHHARPATTTPGSCSTQKIIEREFALSGSEQNPDLTGKSIRAGPAPRGVGSGAPEPVEAFKRPRRGLRRRARPARRWCAG